MYVLCCRKEDILYFSINHVPAGLGRVGGGTAGLAGATGLIFSTDSPLKQKADKEQRSQDVNSKPYILPSWALPSKYNYKSKQVKKKYNLIQHNPLPKCKYTHFIKTW